MQICTVLELMRDSPSRIISLYNLRSISKKYYKTKYYGLEGMSQEGVFKNLRSIYYAMKSFSHAGVKSPVLLPP